LFLFGNGNKDIIGIDSTLLLKSTSDSVGLEKELFYDLTIYHWEVFDYNLFQKMFFTSNKEMFIPSLFEIAVLSIKENNISIIHDMLLFDFGDVYYILYYNYNQWQYINLGL